jgi:alkanesulfonate monooxygenase SsuD/methylene tetrahydromethanopterin reductase-like flavin-dependent oxidoreductase (luciferase family)
MDVGVIASSHNNADWDRVMAGEYDKLPATQDSEYIRHTIALGDMIEPLGFDSIWCTEHYGTPYSMMGNPLQWLAFWAGRTKRVGVGTAVIVLPWASPFRLVHEIAVLDNMLDGRPFHIGIGRGVAAHEYESFGIPSEEGRERFVEMVEILRASTQPRFSYEGKHYQIPETSVRPIAPSGRDLFANMKGAFNTPTSMELAAELGLGQMFVTGSSLETMAGQVAKFNAIRGTKGLAPNQPTVSMYMYCSKDPKQLEKGDRYRIEQLMSARNHYALYGNTDFTQRKGFEDYAKFFGQGGHQTPVSKQLDEDGHLIGTPDQIIEKIQRFQNRLSMEKLLLTVDAGNQTEAEAKASLELFAREVLPEVHKMATPLHAHSRGTEESLTLETGIGGAVG